MIPVAQMIKEHRKQPEENEVASGSALVKGPYSAGVAHRVSLGAGSRAGLAFGRGCDGGLTVWGLGDASAKREGRQPACRARC